MSDIQLKDFAIVIGSAITALSTITAMVVTNRHNLKQAKLNIDTQNLQKQNELRLSKIEDFYLLFEKWETNFGGICVLHLHCYAKKTSYRDAQESIGKSTFLLPGEAQRIKMLLNVHFPSLIEDYRLVDEARRTVAPFFSDPKENKLDITDFINAQAVFENACKTFKSKICKLVSN